VNVLIDTRIRASACQVRTAGWRLSLAQADLESAREQSAGLVPRVDLCAEVQRAEAAVQAAEAAEAEAEHALQEAALAKHEAAAARREAAKSAEMVEQLREELKVTLPQRSRESLPYLTILPGLSRVRFTSCGLGMPFAAATGFDFWDITSRPDKQRLPTSPFIVAQLVGTFHKTLNVACN
jgi:hypothetical protein